MTALMDVRLTDTARHAAGKAAQVPYRDADGTWCEPTAPHVPGCTCPPGGIGCDTCWDAYLHRIATSTPT